MSDVEDLVRDTLAEAAGQAPETRCLPNLGEVEATHSGLRGRIAVVAVAAIVLAIAGVATGVALVRSGHNGQPTSATTGPVWNAKRALVGEGNVAIALPSGWRLNDIDRCGTPAADTIVVPGALGLIAGCGTELPDGVSYVLFPGDTGGKDWATLATEPITLADGTQALRGRAWVRGILPWAGDSETRKALTVVVVPSLRVTAIGISDKPGDLDRALRQISPLPRGAAVVPGLPPIARPTWVREAARLRAAGLVPREVVAPHRNYPSGWVFSITPPVGTVVPKGSTVVVHVSK